MSSVSLRLQSCKIGPVVLWNCCPFFRLTRRRATPVITRWAFLDRGGHVCESRHCMDFSYLTSYAFTSTSSLTFLFCSWQCDLRCWQWLQVYFVFRWSDYLVCLLFLTSCYYLQGSYWLSVINLWTSIVRISGIFQIMTKKLCI